MDNFVRKQLSLCDCLHVSEVMAEHRVDEAAFRTLDKAKIKLILPRRSAEQDRILERVNALRRATTGETPSTMGSRDSSWYLNLFPKIPPELSFPEETPTPKSPWNLDDLKLEALEISRSSSKRSTAARIDGIKVGSVVKKVSSAVLNHQKNLPIYDTKDQLLRAILKNQVVVVKGETGSGKSTQLTQYLLEIGLGVVGKIICTQPRRIAAKSLAERVAHEVGTELGDQVGYRIRFDNKSAIDTTIVYMTDGVLLQELATDQSIHSYSVIILDEAHERNLNTDMLLGLLKSVARRRQDLKLIITSATMDCEEFSQYFNDAVIFDIPGRTFPVDIIHAYHPTPDYINESCNMVMRIHTYEGPGDILVFLGGQTEIEQLCEALSLRDEFKQELHILPCYAALTIEEQNMVFEPTPEGKKRKVVVATNIAETSLTIDGIVYVVDSGIMKESEYNPGKRMTTLVTKYISQSQAIQRAGRAGRTRPGKAYRLYTEEMFNKMAKAPVPEIRRSNLESTLLLLIAHGIQDLFTFDFMLPPDVSSIQTSLDELQDLQALDFQRRLTEIGRLMYRFPLDPRLSKTLITSSKLRCTEDVLIIVALLSVQSTSGNIFVRPKKYQHPADKAKASFFRPHGDHLTLLNVFRKWESNNHSKNWCRENFINFKAMDESLLVLSQLRSIMTQHDLYVQGSRGYQNDEAIQKALVSGYFSQVARKMPMGHGYKTYSNPKEVAFIHPSSALFRSKPNWIIYEEFFHTAKPYLRNVVAIEPTWIMAYAPGFYIKLKSIFPI